MLNVVDQFSIGNNCGFNLANFQPNFIRDHFEDVVKDYERSFIGAFSSALMEIVRPENEQYDIYFTIAKFVNNMGYSLT